MIGLVIASIIITVCVIIRFIIESQGNSKYNKQEIVNSVIEDKIAITSVEDLKKQSSNIKKQVEGERPFDDCVDYKLPNISIIKDNESESFLNIVKSSRDKTKLMIPIGISENDVLFEDINDMPNMLIGGTVMSGKTSYVNAIISYFLMTKKAADVKLIIFDSNRINYSIYETIPLLLTPIIKDSTKLILSLNKVATMIDDRRSILLENNVKSIEKFNEKFPDSKLPSIVIIIDEISKLNASDDLYDAIQYISSNCRRLNIHLIIVANYPSAKDIMQISKDNFLSRLCFEVTDLNASKSILDRGGAEKLSGIGNALYSFRNIEYLRKVKVPFIADSDIDNIVEYINKQRNSLTEKNESNSNKRANSEGYKDPLYEEAVKFVVETGKVSASLIQRRFRIGYNRASRMIDALEERGIIGPKNGSKPREVIVKSDNINEK